MTESCGGVIGLCRIDGGDGNEGRQCPTYRFRIDLGCVSAYDAFRLEPANTRLHSGNGKAGFLRQAREGGSAVCDEFVDDQPIYPVEVFTHLRNVAQSGQIRPSDSYG